MAGDVSVGEAGVEAAQAGPHTRTGGAGFSRPSKLRQPEIQYLHDAVGRDLDVRGFEIAMDDALLMRRLQRLGDLLRDGQRFVDRNRRV